MEEKHNIKIIPSRDDMKKRGVYKIYNSVDEMFYIGSTVKFSNRLAGHVMDIKRNKGNKNLENFTKENGFDSLCFDILEIVDEKDSLKDKENYWISKYDFRDLWNIAPNAENLKGVKMPKSQKESTRKRMLGNQNTKGYKPKKETLKKISDFWKNNPERLEQMKQKNRESQLKAKKKPFKRGNLIEVSLNGEIIDTVLSLKSVKGKYNLKHVMASKLVTGKKESYKGYSLKKVGTFIQIDGIITKKYDSGEIIEEEYKIEKNEVFKN